MAEVSREVKVNAEYFLTYHHCAFLEEISVALISENANRRSVLDITEEETNDLNS